MKTILTHGPVFLTLVAITFAAFGYLMTTPLWDNVDFDIFCDAYAQSQNTSDMFRHIGFYFSQPLLQLIFMLEFRAFGLDPTWYIGINLIIHAISSFVVFMLVNMLFPKKSVAFLAATLFALGVGSYGKMLMATHQLESLLLANLHLLILYFFIRNDFRRKGKIISPLFLFGLFLYLITGLTKTASFSLIGTLIAYKAFFYRWRNGRAIFSLDIMAFIVVGILFHWAQGRWGFQGQVVLQETNPFDHFTLVSFKNIFRYLNLMFFPMQASPVLDSSSIWVQWAFEARTLIRTFVTLSIISFSFFGFVFGNKAIRFFIAWTYITLMPFTGHSISGNWLNLNHLYLTSLGFCVILASGTVSCSNLLVVRRWRRYVPYLVPLIFILLSLGLTYKLDAHHRAFARSPRGLEFHQGLKDCCSEMASGIHESRDSGPSE
ncbi:MAG: hypothetical protein KOO60_12620 [Gemmatimonadales bacterium]|nr:hypothetical protein [Gemmatimonadales bacterium]